MDSKRRMRPRRIGGVHRQPSVLTPRVRRLAIAPLAEQRWEDTDAESPLPAVISINRRQKKQSDMVRND